MILDRITVFESFTKSRKTEAGNMLIKFKVNEVKINKEKLTEDFKSYREGRLMNALGTQMIVTTWKNICFKSNIRIIQNDPIYSFSETFKINHYLIL
jgi:hypothetical protein